MKPQLKQTIQALILLIALGVIWGSGYSIAHYATTNGVSPMGYAFWQSLGPAILLGLLSLTRPGRLPLGPRYLLFYVIAGLLGIAIPNTNMYYSAQHLPAGLLAVIVNVAPIITYIIALATREERFRFLRSLGVLAAIIGILLLALPKQALPDHSLSVWVVTTLISPVCFAVAAVYTSKQRPQLGHDLSLAAGMLIASTLWLLPVMWHEHSFYSLHWPLQLPDYAVLLEVVLSSIGYLLFFALIRVAGAVYYSLVAGVVAITGLVWGRVLFNEHLNDWMLVAVTLVVLGILVVSWQGRKRT